MNDLFVALGPYLPDSVTVQVEATGDVIDDATGALTGAWTDTPVLPVVGGSAAQYAAPSGFFINWNTTTILAGHRLRGRTFFVPSASDVYDSDGSIGATILAAIQAAADSFVAAATGDLVVWHRPVGGSGGGHGLVLSATAPDKVGVLRSRRD